MTHRTGGSRMVSCQSPSRTCSFDSRCWSNRTAGRSPAPPRRWCRAATRSPETSGASPGRELFGEVAVQGTSADERRRRPRHAGADAADEVALDALPDGVGAAVGVEALEIEPEALGALPE